MQDRTRLDVAQVAVDQVLMDWRHHGGPQPAVRVWLNADGEVCIWVDGGGTTPSAWGDTPIELATSVADHLHAELMDQAHQVLPLCPDHRCGLHPTATDPGPAWHCTAGDHIVGEVGTPPSHEADLNRRDPR